MLIMLLYTWKNLAAQILEASNLKWWQCCVTLSKPSQQNYACVTSALKQKLDREKLNKLYNLKQSMQLGEKLIYECFSIHVFLVCLLFDSCCHCSSCSEYLCWNIYTIQKSQNQNYVHLYYIPRPIATYSLDHLPTIHFHLLHALRNGFYMRCK